MRNWTYFIRDSIITESIRIVYDGNAEMRNEAVYYSELEFFFCVQCVHSFVYISSVVVVFFCVCDFFSSRLLFQNRELYKQEVEQKRKDGMKESE